MNAGQVMETSQYLEFMLEGETFAIDILKIREVLEFTRLTKVPRMPEFMRGVINLRGQVVPVVDLKHRFGMGVTEKTIHTRIIIGEVEVMGEKTVLGALADSVQEVMELDPDNIEPPPKIGARLNTEFIRGMGKRDDTFVMILDIDRVFSSEELLAVSASGELNAENVSGEEEVE